jgi:hypothetical protein
MDQNPIHDLASRVITDPELAKKFSADPAGELSKAAVESGSPAYVGDKVVYRIVVLALALVMLTAAVGAIVLSWNGKLMPDSLVALGSAAVGALAGLLAPSPVRGAK